VTPAGIFLCPAGCRLRPHSDKDGSEPRWIHFYCRHAPDKALAAFSDNYDTVHWDSVAYIYCPCEQGPAWIQMTGDYFDDRRLAFESDLPGGG
jgi:hypothetical protein